MAADLLPTLDSTSQNVLREIYDRGIVRGVELLQSSKIDKVALQNAINVLIKNSLVSASGSMNDSQEVLRSFFTIQPSGAGIVRSLIGK